MSRSKPRRSTATSNTRAPSSASQPIDLPIIFIPGNVVLVAGVVAGYSSLWGVVVALTIAAALVAFKWRKPDDHLERMLSSALTPRRFSHKERDVLLRPFPLDHLGARR